MRLSVEQDDKGFNQYESEISIVFLDEKIVSNCITADEELGYIKRYKTDEFDDVIIDRVNECLVYEELYGKVRIENENNV